MLANILLPVPFRAFTYLVPPALEGIVRRGSRVRVTFGTRSLAGIVLDFPPEAPADVILKPIEALLESAPTVSEDQLALWEWVAEYYMCPLGDVYKAAVPAPLRSATTKTSAKRAQRLSESGQDAITTAPFSESELSLTLPPLSPLSAAQQEAYDAILRSFATHAITLLHGVTSSGKTEIYIHLIAHTLALGKRVLYLLPEIALTTQMEERLRRVFGERLGVYHSRYTDVHRERVYRRQLSAHPYDVLLGVRSSVFLPFRDLGLVIVDEEHEPSYKQQEPAPRYHARNVAMMLARQQGAKTLLGTATPSVETYARACSSPSVPSATAYGYVSLTTRYRDLALPQVEMVDIARLRFQRRMKGAFSPRLLEAMGEALGRGEQIILFQNRRGYANLMMCERCGWVPRCTRCDVSLTYHRTGRQLVCHYCGNHFPIPTTCPQCTASIEAEAKERATAPPPRLRLIGTGTERIEEQVAKQFPAARVARMDLDTTRTRTAFEQLITDFAAHKSDILIGTQMVSKGLDFPDVSLVGVLDADNLLSAVDFRASERTYQLLAQVAGRSGRQGRQGLVIIQARTVRSPLLAQVARDDYAAMHADQMAERQLFGYPPFTRLIFIYLRHSDNAVVGHAADEMGMLLRRTFGEQVFGPETPPVGRLQGLYVRKLMLKVSPNVAPSAVRRPLQQAEQAMQRLPYAARINIFFDVDPL